MNSTSRKAMGALGVVGLALTAAPAAVAAGGNAAAEQGTAGDYIVLLNQSAKVASAGGLDTASGKAAAQAHTNRVVEGFKADGIEVKRTYSTLGGFSATLTAEQAAELQNDPAVASITKDTVVTLGEQKGSTQRITGAPAAGEQKDPYSWGLDRIDQANLPLDNVFKYAASGQGITAYVIDSGARSSHLDFTGRIKPGKDVVNDGLGTEDCLGHGTHVAGTVAGEFSGVAKEASIVPVRVFGCEGSAPNSQIIEGMDWVAANAKAPAVVNMSLGGPVDPASDQAAERLVDAGLVTVVAAGNDANDACENSPSREPKVLTVAATDQKDNRSIFGGGQESSYGKCVDLFAPGSNIVSSGFEADDQLLEMGGTSMAAPHVAGAAALYLQKNPKATVAEVNKAITSTATQGKVKDLKGSPNLLLNTTELLKGGDKPDPDPKRDLVRWGGKDRYETAAEVATSGQKSAATVYLASGQGFSDAMTSSNAAAGSARTAALPGDGDVPTLLTRTGSLPASTKAALQKLGTKSVTVIGGEKAVSPAVEAELKAMGLGVKRISGGDRYETSANVAKRFGSGVDTLYVASGEDKAYADALAGAALAGSKQAPVLLTRPDQADAVTMDAVKSLAPKKVVVLGGPAAVSDAVAKQVGASERLAGADRYETSVAIAKKFEGEKYNFFATGHDYADALSGGTMAANQDSPLLLTRQQALPGSVGAYVKADPADHNVIVGGPAAVSTTVEASLKAALGIK
ncbi:cell wall-binding repeat-containing protein [Kytococcus sp. HMSC28H12]|uniref:cell wall-binding repeat-containing protein n=1 Tax=Kytococcus sp. HMSC28H12 TaxID=1581067 RepID=UPI0008A2F277|nr:cell wall-binding repeat-containing protein [Kytococcus sp. HMSC28H12]OFS11939.1 hypothetical protein HMPREF3099_07525 [Kytococcus sp. HMSC28H12]